MVQRVVTLHAFQSTGVTVLCGQYASGHVRRPRLCRIRWRLPATGPLRDWPNTRSFLSLTTTILSTLDTTASHHSYTKSFTSFTMISKPTVTVLPSHTTIGSQHSMAVRLEADQVKLGKSREATCLAKASKRELASRLRREAKVKKSEYDGADKDERNSVSSDTGNVQTIKVARDGNKGKASAYVSSDEDDASVIKIRVSDDEDIPLSSRVVVQPPPSFFAEMGDRLSATSSVQSLATGSGSQVSSLAISRAPLVGYTEAGIPKTEGNIAGTPVIQPSTNDDFSLVNGRNVAFRG